MDAVLNRLVEEQEFLSRKTINMYLSFRAYEGVVSQMRDAYGMSPIDNEQSALINILSDIESLIDMVQDGSADTILATKTIFYYQDLCYLIRCWQNCQKFEVARTNCGKQIITMVKDLAIAAMCRAAVGGMWVVTVAAAIFVLVKATL